MRRFFLAFALVGVAGAAGAQGWPAKPVRLISQFPPGGGTDLIARNLIPGLSEAFGQNFILEHKPGAAGNIAADHVAKSAADGYTILIANNTIVIQAALPQKLSFVALAVHPSSSFPRCRRASPISSSMCAPAARRPSARS